MVLRNTSERLFATLLFVVAVILGIGIISVYASSGLYAENTFGNEWLFVSRHIIALAIGFFASIIAFVVPTSFWATHAPLFLGLSLLASVISTQSSYSGYITTIDNGVLSFLGTSIKLRDIVLLFYSIYLTSFLTDRFKFDRSFWQTYFPLSIIIGLVASLLFFQGELLAIPLLFFFSAILITSVEDSLGYAVGYGVGLGILAVLFLWGYPSLLNSHLSLKNGLGDSDILTIISQGGWSGTGVVSFNQILQQDLFWNSNATFMFIAQQLGFLGSLFVISAYLLGTGICMWLARTLVDPFSIIFSVSCGVLIGLYTVFHLLAVLNVFSGNILPLPFLSYGISGVVPFSFFLGILGRSLFTRK